MRKLFHFPIWFEDSVLCCAVWLPVDDIARQEPLAVECTYNVTFISPSQCLRTERVDPAHAFHA